ncbi:AsmA-like C-terminal region-containing protein [Catalinimonas niigatensis]|uniref:AsmA-like C-terminal region-containing protein n=1 Tax=Catalinimonas niigatensis TaxID=1397264 RepID=UPI0026653193|nr:AsmA-like C-terminal region-containing protein [Catalinimonas niigatensis]WPP48179.1 AsmA-like C-terminal region-containing protein [Catalinimonas niigatensis]
MFRKIFLTLFTIFILLLTGGSLLTYLYQDQLIKHFVTQANQLLATPVKVKSIRLSLWEKFPQVAISLEDVEIVGSLPQQAGPGLGSPKLDSLLAKAEHLDFTFNLWRFIQGEYVINKVYLSNTEVMLAIDQDGDNNYSIFKKRDSNSDDGGVKPLRFELKKIFLKNVNVSYEDLQLRQHHKLLAKDVEALLKVVGEQYDIALEGALTSHFIRIGTDTYFENKALQLATKLQYDYPNRYLRIDTTRIGVGSGNFLLSGIVDQANNDYVDIQVRGERTDLQTLLSLLPEPFIRQWQAYRSEGKAYFEGKVQGNMNRTFSPLVELRFGCQNASFYHPDYKKRMEEISLNGTFSNGTLHSLRSSQLDLQNITGQLDGRPITGSLTLSNFEDFFLSCHVKTNMDINSLFTFYPIPEIKAARGELNANFEISGRIEDLRGESQRYWQRIKSKGDISLQNIDLLWQTDKLPVQSLNGNMMFKGNDLSLSNVEAYVGSSHIVLNGMLRNAFAYLLSNTQPVHIEADLFSRQIDMDELLSGQTTDASSSADWQTVADSQFYRFRIDPKLQLSFDCHVEKIKFRRFRGRHLKGKLDVENQIIQLKQSSIQTAGGKVTAKAYVNARRPDMITVKAKSSFEHLRADSIFYTFEDFGQDFLTARHLEGKIYADVDWNMNFNHSLQLDYPSLKVDVLTTIIEGKLNNFEPMQKLGRFVEEEGLSHLRFAELNNHIRIEDQKIFIPRMQVSSNVSDIWVEGIHTFNNNIDYRFEVPMKTFSIRKTAARERAKAREQKFGEILEDDAAPLNLFLTAKGSVDDYKISYDMENAKKAFKENLQNEKQELRQIIRDKGTKPTYQLELDEDEYFDFEDNKSKPNKKP